MCEPRRAGARRPRGPNSRLICLGCRERRIRCELPKEVDIPELGELQTIQTPCYRCERLGIPCVVRKTILGRSGHERSSTTATDSGRTRIEDSRIIVELPTRTVARTQPAPEQGETAQLILQTKANSSNDPPRSQGDPARWIGDTLLVHKPQSSETVLIIRALDTIRCENVEESWPRHLVVRAGHTRALDLSIKAIVAACAYARGVPKVTPGDCYRALALALGAVQANIKQSHGKPNDDMLASTALLAPFDRVIKRHDIPMRVHVEGLAAILAARPATYQVSQLARDILDFYACDSAIMACIQGTPSPFETIDRAYFANDGMTCSMSDQAQLKAIANELFICTPRLVELVRTLRLQPCLQKQLLFDGLRLVKSLLRLQDSHAERRLLRNIKTRRSSDTDPLSPLRRSLHFDSDQDFEALVGYWQSRLSLRRLEWHLHNLAASGGVQADSTDEPHTSCWPCIEPCASKETFKLVQKILMCSEYAARLRLRKRRRLFAHAMVVVWGAKMDTPMALSPDQDEKDIVRSSVLLLRRVNAALAAKPELTAEDMDAAADIFAGGSPNGRYAELYGL